MHKFLKISFVLIFVGSVSDSRPAAAFYHSRERTVKVSLGASEFYFDPRSVTVPAGEVNFVIRNRGRYPHGLAFDGGGISQGIRRVDPGQSKSLTVRFTEPGEVIFYCPLKGHRERGQEGIAVVTSTQASKEKDR